MSDGQWTECMFVFITLVLWFDRDFVLNTCIDNSAWETKKVCKKGHIL